MSTRVLKKHGTPAAKDGRTLYPRPHLLVGGGTIISTNQHSTQLAVNTQGLATYQTSNLEFMTAYIVNKLITYEKHAIKCSILELENEELIIYAFTV